MVLEDIPPPTENWLGVSPVTETKEYCTAKILSNMIVGLEDKVISDNKNAFVGVAGVKDYDIFFNALEKNTELKNEELQVSNGFSALIKHDLKPYYLTWYDTGNIKGYANANKKMSKSDDNLNNLIALLDTPDVIRKKVKRAVTDSGSEIRYDKSRPGISNLISMYALLTDTSFKTVEKAFEGKMYSDFKVELGDIMTDCLAPVQKKYTEIINDKAYLESILSKGAKNAYSRARKTLTKVYRKVGFVLNKSGS